MTTAIANHALAAVIEARIHSLLEQRRWDRRWMRATWTQARHDREVELRALIRLVRSARKLARTAEERTDPMTEALAEQDRSYPVGVSYHDYQSSAEAQALR